MKGNTMNIDNLTIKECREIAKMFGHAAPSTPYDNGMIGKYVIVRCRDAGVHAGVLESHNGRECVLSQSRRLWYWKPADNKSFLSGVAVAGLHKDSKIGVCLEMIHLTETCEIIACTNEAESSIQIAPEHVQ